MLGNHLFLSSLPYVGSQKEERLDTARCWWEGLKVCVVLTCQMYSILKCTSVHVRLGQWREKKQLDTHQSLW